MYMVTAAPMSAETKLLLLRVQLFGAIHELSGEDAAGFWALIDDVHACRPVVADA